MGMIENQGKIDNPSKRRSLNSQESLPEKVVSPLQPLLGSLFPGNSPTVSPSIAVRTAVKLMEEIG